MEPAGRCWRVVIHVSADRIGLKGEYTGAVALSVSADVCSVPGALELLESWFSVDKQASFQILITEQSAPPAALVTAHAPFAMHFVALTLERSVSRDATEAIERERRLSSELKSLSALATVAE